KARSTLDPLTTGRLTCRHAVFGRPSSAISHLPSPSPNGLESPFYADYTERKMLPPELTNITGASAAVRNDAKICLERFRERFGADATHMAYGPGRANLIGETQT